MQLKIIICDLDGTLFNIDHRLHLLEEKRWDDFYRACVDDTPNEWCVELLWAMSAQHYPIYFVSGRNELVREETLRQLYALGFKTQKLFMRPRDNREADVTFKQKLLSTELAHLDILFAVEDRKRVAEMYRGNGITVLQCDEGDF